MVMMAGMLLMVHDGVVLVSTMLALFPMLKIEMICRCIR